MNAELSALIITAASIGFLHTLFGPDHYLPFIMMSWARKWSRTKTLVITFLCGLGHIASSIVLGMIGVSLGIAVKKLELIESSRGNVAAWLLIAFGLAYFIWGLHRAIRKKPHKHIHIHADGEEHMHPHTHEAGHTHVHEETEKKSLTPWILFTIFVFGPCEPLIPLVMYPAAKHNIGGVVVVSVAFGLTTILTMLSIIAVSSWGVSFVRLGQLERYAHALAGAMIFISGLSVQFLGL